MTAMQDFERDTMKITGQIGPDFPSRGSRELQEEYLKNYTPAPKAAQPAKPVKPTKSIEPVKPKTAKVDRTLNRADAATGTKRCSKCGERLPVDCFHKQAKAPDGLQPWCKNCVRSRDKQRKNSPANNVKPRPAAVDVQPQAEPVLVEPAVPTPPLPGSLPASDQANLLAFFADERLAGELRRRGWEITAVKHL